MTEAVPEASTVSVAGALEEVLATCAAGRSRLVLIEGPAGCGKSHILNAVAARADAAGALVLAAAATATERQEPLSVLRRLIAAAPAFALPRSGAEGAPPADAVEVFGAELCALARGGPVVLCLDDLQHTDPQTLTLLPYLVQHARPAPVLVVTTLISSGTAQDPVLLGELARHPHVRRIPLGLLSPRETAGALTARAAERGTPAPAWTAAELHRLSGGNPMLLTALLAEDMTVTAAAPAADGPFAAAVTACLRRSGPAAVAAARAVAVLDEGTTEPLTAKMLDDDAEVAGPGLTALRRCGLLDGLRFPDPVVRTAVLADTTARVRADLHRRAAMALREVGAPAPVVAAHLLAPLADGIRRPARPEDLALLRDTAEDLLLDDRPAPAERILELAHGVCPDAGTRTDVALRLAQAAARRDPDTAGLRLGALGTGPRALRPGGEDASRLAELLLTHGRIEEADSVLASEDGRPAPGGSPFGALLDADPEACVRLLESAPLTDATLPSLVAALRTLLYTGSAERAVSAGRRVLAEAEDRQVPGWQAMLGTLHAEALLRLGDVRAAYDRATAALEALPPRGGSLFRYAPAAVLVQACDALGLRSEAARHIAHPVSRRLLTTVHGAHYLRARGSHHLVTGRPHAALADFRAVGRLLVNWRTDRPAWLPWRTDAAQALLCLDRPRQAHRLVEEQLALPDAARPRVRGVSLRLLAATGECAQRTDVLREAVDELRRSGARLETARALADLGRALHDEDVTVRGDASLRAAAALARQMGATALCDEFLPDPGLDRLTRRRMAGPDALALLSPAERRVAVLASEGLTSRQIAARLEWGTSTVEQHLTRVHRKLRVRVRGGSPADLAGG
ncbi:AAA family ATPase [Streptomyces sp. NPDC001480]|uniref:AAA family ATPase n=1 Tax=Streptomyces sp. NPDC001480 TaxID=3364577 RepID=UPI0036A76337